MTVKIDGTNTAANPAFTGADTDTGLQCGSNEVKLVTGGTARATVDSSGSLGVGTESPDNRLHVASGSSTQVKYQATNSGSVYTRFENTDNARGYIGYEAKKLVFYADNGSDSSNKKIAAMDADGLKFNEDTAAANALSDYEEGTFTPSIQETTNPISGITYTERHGYYTKIGNLVYVAIKISWSARTNTSSHTASVTLPFPTINQTHYRGSIQTNTYNVTYEGYGFDSSSGRNIGAMSGSHMNRNNSYTEIGFTGKNGGLWGSNGVRVNGLGSSGGSLQMSGTYMCNA
jgi:hypothetical protein